MKRGGPKAWHCSHMLHLAAIILLCNKICLQIASPQPSLHAYALTARMPLFSKISRHVCIFSYCIAMQSPKDGCKLSDCMVLQVGHGK